MTDTTLGKLETTQSDRGYVPVDAVFSAPTPDAAEVVGLGDYLRRARAAAGLTLDSASARTRIKRDYLEALEAMDPRGLPSRAYCVGYLRTYAQFLGLNAAACVDQFKAELEVDTGRATPTAPQERREIKLPRGCSARF
jgi:cytoskeleton protein RodZ